MLRWYSQMDGLKFPEGISANNLLYISHFLKCVCLFRVFMTTAWSGVVKQVGCVRVVCKEGVWLGGVDVDVNVRRRFLRLFLFSQVDFFFTLVRLPCI